MTVKRVQVDGKPAYKSVATGKAYSYTAGDKASRNRARSLAERQARAAKSR